MSIVVQMPLVVEPKERRLHLRDVSETAPGKTAGSALRERRLSMGLDEAAVAAQLRIRKDQLIAIETGDYERLPGRTYAIGFIRSYARLAGLNAETLVEQFKLEMQALDVHKPVALVFPDAAPQSRWPSGHLFAFALVLAVLVYALVHLTMPSADSAKVAVATDNSVTVVDDVPPAEAVKQSVPAPQQPAATMAATPAAAPQAVSPEPLPLAAILPDPGDHAMLVARLADDFQRISAATPVPAESGAAGSESPAPSRITLKALEETYVQVKDPSLKKPHAVLLARVLSPGESFQAPDRQGLVLLTGNAGGVHVEVDGQSAGVLGKSGQVIKRLPLEPAYFLSRIGTSQ